MATSRMGKRHRRRLRWKRLVERTGQNPLLTNEIIAAKAVRLFNNSNAYLRELEHAQDSGKSSTL